jgi:hypothetical protein
MNVGACVNIYTLHFSSLVSHLLLIFVQVFVSLLPSGTSKHLSFYSNHTTGNVLEKNEQVTAAYFVFFITYEGEYRHILAMQQC